MKVIVENSAKKCLDDIFYYNMKYSSKNAIETDITITQYMQDLEKYPYMGRYIPEFPDKHFREIIYRRNRHSGYRIMYYISEESNTIYVINIINCKQDFKHILQIHNYFSDYLNF